MGSIGKTIASAGQFSVMYGEAMLKDVKPDMFARLPLGKDGKPVQTNHPAWVFGHLSTYAQRMLEAIGRPAGEWTKPAGWDDLFKNGTPCKDDPAGTIYPKMDEITRFYLGSYKAILAALPEVDDAVLLAPAPTEGRMKELLPTVGALCTFLLTGHPMSHLGQVSAWRRFMGLGSAM